MKTCFYCLIKPTYFCVIQFENLTFQIQQTFQIEQLFLCTFIQEYIFKFP